MRALEEIEIGGGSMSPLTCSGVELRALCCELRRARRTLRVIASSTRCARSLRAARRSLRHDLCGADDNDNAIAADGFDIRGLGALEDMTRSSGDRLAFTGQREVMTLLVEIRRLRRALFRIGKGAGDCPRTRHYVARVLAKNRWAASQDHATHYATGPAMIAQYDRIERIVQ